VPLSKDDQGERETYTIQIVMNDRMVSPEPKPLEELKGLVTADIITILKRCGLISLKQHYPVKINAEVLKSIQKYQRSAGVVSSRHSFSFQCIIIRSERRSYNSDDYLFLLLLVSLLCDNLVRMRISWIVYMINIFIRQI
jgi:hypothetical protein